MGRLQRLFHRPGRALLGSGLGADVRIHRARRPALQGVNPELLSNLSAAIRDATQRPFEVRDAIPVGGGSIIQAYRLEGTDGSRYFVKLNDARHLPMFAADAQGLNAIA